MRPLLRDREACRACRDDLRQDVVGFYGMIYPLVLNVQKTMENHHQNSEFFPLNIVIFHSYGTVYQRVWDGYWFHVFFCYF